VTYPQHVAAKIIAIWEKINILSDMKKADDYK